VKNFKHILFLLLLLLSYNWLKSQTTLVEGYLKENITNTPISFAHVIFKGTNTGGTTDTSGYFKISIATNKLVEDSIIFSSMGYTSKKVAITKGTKQQLEVLLNPNLFQLGEFEVKPGENPSWAVMRKIIENKEQNNPEKLDNYYCKEYSKVRFDLNHFTDKIKKNILLRPFDYIWENTKQTEDGIQYLPMLLVEQSVDHYAQSSPKDKKDIIIGKQQTGLAGRNLLKFIEDLAISPNLYNNYVVILDKNFPSPINDNYKNNYQFYLVDSNNVSGNKEYKIIFSPKHKRELGFNGEMYIDSGSYAIKEVSLRFDIKANVNFVRSYLIKQKYEKVDNEHWMMTEANVLGDFTVLENVSDLTGFFGRKSSSYINYKFNQPIEQEVFDGIDIKEFKKDYKDKDSTFWNDARLIEFNEEDEKVISMVERVEKDPAFVLRKNIITSIVTGYIPIKDLDFGNLYTFYSYNTIEKSRVKLGFRVNPKEKFPIGLSAYGAYGTFDEKWKYGGKTFINIGKDIKKQQRIGANYKFDIEQLGRSPYHLPLDHIITSFTHIGANSSKNYVQDYNIYFEKNITSGLTTRLNYFNNKITPTLNNNYYAINDENNIDTLNSLKASGVDVTFKFSFLHKGISGEFYDKADAYNSFRKYPDIAIQYKYADQDNFKSDYNFQKVKLSLKQQLRAKKIGYFTYFAEVGKTIGTVPYPYLDIPFGNQQILLDDHSFNLMDFLEYASDQYLSVHLSHHFDGLFMDRLPLINELKWRSFVFGKGYFSSISAGNNQGQYLFPEELQSLNEPYYEVGFGFENIFKIAKMDFVWRIKDNPTKDTYYFMVKPSFKFSF